MLDSRIQTYLREVVARSREPVPAGAFVLYVHPLARHPFMNYAIPAPGATDGDGRELIRAAPERGLVPRLEYVESWFPWAEAALVASGFTLRGRLRLMTCESGAASDATIRSPDLPAGVELRQLQAGSDPALEMLTVTRSAFGDGPSDADAVARWDGSISGSRGRS